MDSCTGATTTLQPAFSAQGQPNASARLLRNRANHNPSPRLLRTGATTPLQPAFSAQGQSQPFSPPSPPEVTIMLQAPFLPHGPSPRYSPPHPTLPQGPAQCFSPVLPQWSAHCFSPPHLRGSPQVCGLKTSANPLVFCFSPYKYILNTFPIYVIYSNTLVHSSPHLPVYCMGRWVRLHCFFQMGILNMIQHFTHKY